MQSTPSHQLFWGTRSPWVPRLFDGVFKCRTPSNDTQLRRIMALLRECFTCTFLKHIVIWQATSFVPDDEKEMLGTGIALSKTFTVKYDRKCEHLTNVCSSASCTWHLTAQEYWSSSESLPLTQSSPCYTYNFFQWTKFTCAKATCAPKACKESLLWRSRVEKVVSHS